MDRVVYQRIAVPMQGSQPLLGEIKVTWFVPRERFDEVLQWVEDNLELTVPSKLRMVRSSETGRKFRSLDFWVDGEHKVQCIEMLDSPMAVAAADVH